MTAGIDTRAGHRIPDADLQDPPELIPTWCAWREGRTWSACDAAAAPAAGSSAPRPMPTTRLLNWLSKADIPADTGDFRLMSRKAVQGPCSCPSAAAT